MSVSHTVARRSFLQRASALAVGMLALPRTSIANDLSGTMQDNDAWLAKLRAPHRQLFDMSTPNGGLPMVHVLNYIDTYNRAYNAKDADVNAIGTFYGQTTLLAANDAMWAKYKFGAMLPSADDAMKASTKNPWRTSVSALGMDIPAASIEALQKRGVVFLVCNNALNFWVGQVARATNQQVADVDREIRANLLPGVVVVPAMVIAIEKAQKAGFAYNKQS